MVSLETGTSAHLYRLRETALIHVRMSRVCESWSLDDLVGMTEQDMNGLLSHYQAGDIPPLLEVRMKNSVERV